MKRNKITLALALVAALAITACSTPSEPPPLAQPPATQGQESPVDETADEGPDIAGTTMVLYVTYNQPIVDFVVPRFEEATGVRVEVLMAGTGELMARLRAEAANPQADVLWGGAIFSVVPDIDLFEDYTSINEPYMAPTQRNLEGPFTRFHTSARLLMTNTDLLDELGIELDGYGSLLQPEMRGRIAFTDPAASASAYNHLVNMLYAMGDGVDPETGWDFVREFIEQLDGIMLPGSSAVVQGVADGEFAAGLTPEESPWEYIEVGAPVGAVYISEGIAATSSAVIVVNGASNRDAARAFVDFVTSHEIQSVMEAEIGRRPVLANIPGAGLGMPGNDELNWIDYDINAVLDNREDWLDRFREIWMETWG
jgi:iron(III) transport system substrate-binding protein